jgi:hypothetical protein
MPFNVASIELPPPGIVVREPKRVMVSYETAYQQTRNQLKDFGNTPFVKIVSTKSSNKSNLVHAQSWGVRQSD